MAKIIVYTDDSRAVLTACRNMINEVLRGRPGSVDTDNDTVDKLEDETPTGPTLGNEVTVKGVTGDGEQHNGNHTVTTVTNVEVDTHGVAFSGEFCGKSDVPFYASGKRKGQWKRRRGADEAAYDIWYAEQRSAVTNQTAPDDEQVDTAGAFGAGDGGAATAENPAPTDCGSFMGWVSAKQAGGLLTQTDIGDAYGHAGLQVTDLFPPKDEATVAQNVATLYQILVVKAGA